MSWLAVSLLVLTSAPGDPTTRRTAVDYRVAPSCPTAMEFALELSRRTDVVQFTEHALASAFLELRVTPSGKRFVGRMTLRFDDGTVNERRFEGPKCESVAKALALAAAVVLDPENAKTGPLDESPPPREPEPEPVAEPPTTPEEPARVPSTPVEVERVQPEQASPWLEGSFAAAALMSNAVTTAPDLGGEASGALWVGRREARWRWVSLLAVGGLTGRVVESPNGRARYAPRVTTGLGTGVGFTWRALRLGVAAELRLDPLFVEGLDGDETLSALRLLVALGPAVFASVDLGPLQLGLRASLPLTLRKERYVIEPRGEVFAVPPFAVVAAIVVGLRVE